MLGITYVWYNLYETLGLRPFDPWNPDLIREYPVRLAREILSATFTAHSFSSVLAKPRWVVLSDRCNDLSPIFHSSCALTSTVDEHC